MKNSKALRLVLALTFAFLTVANQLANANGRISSTLVSSPQTTTAASNGFIQFTQPPLRCDSNGSCRVQPENFRDSQQTTVSDGQRIYVSTTDSMPLPQYRSGPSAPPPAQRLKFSVSSAPEPAVARPSAPQAGGNGQGIEMLPPLKVDIHKNSREYDDFMKIAPAVGTAVINTIEDLQKSAAVAARLQGAYQQSMQGIRSANDHLARGADAHKEANEIVSNRFRVLAAAAMAAPVDIRNNNAEYQKYLKAAEDPFSFREYELIGATPSQTLSAAKTAIQNRQPRKAVQLANALLHQKDPRLRAEANRQLAQGFNDGILRTQQFGSSSPSVLDGARYKTPQHSPAGEIIRYIANKAQIAWLDTQGLTTLDDEQGSAYMAGLLALRESDNAFVQRNAAAGLYLARVADSLFNYSIGIAHGAFEGLSETVKSLPALAKAVATFGLDTARESLTNPLALQMQSAKIVEALPGVVAHLAVHYWSLVKQYGSGNDRQRGEVVGQIVSDILVTYVTEGAGVAIKGATVAAHASKFGEIAAKFGKSAIVPVMELTERLGAANAKSIAAIALADKQLAVDVVKAAETLTERGAKDAYLNTVLNSGKPVGATIKSTTAITEAINSGAIQSTEQLAFAKTLQGALDHAPHQLKIRVVGDNGKVIVIGRSMESNVIPVEKILKRNGVDSELIALSEQAKVEWIKWKNEFPYSDVPVEIQKAGIGYMENVNWMKEKIKQGYTVIDAGNPMNAPPSLYYDMEDDIIKRALEQAKAKGLE